MGIRTSQYQDVPRHRLVEMGQHILGKEPSSWFGPTSAAQAVGHLFETSKEVSTISVI